MFTCLFRLIREVEFPFHFKHLQFCQLQPRYFTMDADVEIMYVPSGEKCITRHNLKVNVSDSHNRKLLPASLEARIDEIWSRRVADNPTMWNGSKFRIASVSDSDDDVTFNLGITSYKDFIGTNWSPEATALRQLGDQDYSNTQVSLSLQYVNVVKIALLPRHGDRQPAWYCLLLLSLLRCCDVCCHSNSIEKQLLLLFILLLLKSKSKVTKWQRSAMRFRELCCAWHRLFQYFCTLLFPLSGLHTCHFSPRQKILK